VSEERAGCEAGTTREVDLVSEAIHEALINEARDVPQERTRGASVAHAAIPESAVREKVEDPVIAATNDEIILGVQDTDEAEALLDEINAVAVRIACRLDRMHELAEDIIHDLRAAHGGRTLSVEVGTVG